VKNINLIAWQSIPNTTYSMVKITVPGYTMQNYSRLSQVSSDQLSQLGNPTAYINCWYLPFFPEAWLTRSFNM